MDLTPALRDASAASTAVPIDPADRMVSLDVLRGFALLGILVMNIQSFARHDAAYLNPSALGPRLGADAWVWYLCHLFADLKFMGLFSMLFGAGIVLMADRCQRRGDSAARIHYRRLAGLLVIGLAHAYLLWSGDILVPYAVCGSFVFLAWRMDAAWLAALGVGAFSIGGLIWLSLGLAILLLPQSELAALDAEAWTPTAAEIQADLETFRGSWLTQQSRRLTDSLSAHLIMLPILFWRICGLMLIGMALYRSGVLTGQPTSTTYRRMAGWGFGLGLPLIAIGIYWNIQRGWPMEYSLFLGSLPNYIGSLFVSLAYVAVVHLLLRGRIASLLTANLAPVGKMALTNYLGQTILCTTLFYGHGLGWYGELSDVELVPLVVVVWAVQIAGSRWWMNHFQFGPVERAWRLATYGR